MTCPLPNCPGRHASSHVPDRQFPDTRLVDSPIRDAAAPPIFREVLAAMTNSRPYGPPAVVSANLENSRRPGVVDNGAGYLRRRAVPPAADSNTGPDPGRPGDPWRRVLNH